MLKATPDDHKSSTKLHLEPAAFVLDADAGRYMVTGCDVATT